MVDAIRAKIDRAQHLCAVGQLGACPAALAMAANTGSGLADWKSADRSSGNRLIAGRLAVRSDQHVLDQPLRTVRAASSGQQSRWQSNADTEFPDAAVLQVRAAPDLPRLDHRILGGADDDCWPPGVRGWDDRIHLRWHNVGRARFDRSLRRRIPP